MSNKMTVRVNLSQSAPELYKTVFELEKLLSIQLKEAHIDEGFSHLLRLRASQINQCAFCIRLHTQDAAKSGESLERISVVSAWKETEYFTAKERAALTLVEEITLIPAQHYPEHVYEQAQKDLNKSEISAIEWLAIVINTWNRIAISSQYRVSP